MSANQPSSKERTGANSDLARYSGLGLSFALTVLAFAFAGHWLDERWDSSPWLLIAGVFLGFALGLYSMVKKLPSRASRSRRAKHPPPPPEAQ